MFYVFQELYVRTINRCQNIVVRRPEKKNVHNKIYVNKKKNRINRRRVIAVVLPNRRRVSYVI